jgi:catechol 2,3-dioxygenase-like lactoylglutathione lyase family enzyme
VSVTTQELDRLAAERKRIRDTYLIPREHRPATTARGIHHAALISGDVVRTVEFYRNVLGFPLTEVFENRDLPGSTHFFFDVGHGNALAFFDLPGLDLGEYAEVLGGLHHMAISLTPDEWEAARRRLDEAGVPYQLVGGISMYFRDPDGARLELIRQKLGMVHGRPLG